jgi:hypothetical protein
MVMNGGLLTAVKLPEVGREELLSVLSERLRSLASGLDAHVLLGGVTGNGFVAISIQGSDNEFFTELIKRELGLAPSNLREIEINDNLKAYARRINARRQSIEVEIGPASTDLKSEITREALTAQLCDGRNMPVDLIARTYCIQEGVPILARITSIDPERGEIEAWFSDDQIARFEQWRRERFHRIIAVGGSQDKLREAIRLSKVERDIVKVEELAFTASSLVCKLGTDAPGIIAKIGPYVSNFKLHSFIPARVDRLRFGPIEPKQMPRRKSSP